MTRNSFRKLLTVLLTVGLAAVAVYLGLVGTRLVGGVTLTENPPAHLVRLQVLHAAGEKANASAVAGRVRDVTAGSLDLRVVEIREFDLRAVTRTTIVSRIEDKTAAELLAERLGMDPEAVYYRPLEHNTRQVTTTLIVGPDFENILTTLEAKKELQKES